MIDYMLGWAWAREKYLFLKDNIKLHSGEESDFKIECDALTDKDIKTLAYLISKRIKFQDVIGVPTGGLRLEKELLRYKTKSGNVFLIVDDVLTTGGSMEEMKNNIVDGIGADLDIKGIVIFAIGKCPDWIEPVFQMWEDQNDTY